MSTFWLKCGETKLPIRRGEMLLGRSPYCSVVLSGAQVSRQHCILRHVQGEVFLEDLGSTNGTTVNGERILAPHRIAGGDEIRVGEHVLGVLEGEPADSRLARKTTEERPSPFRTPTRGGTRDDEVPTQAGRDPMDVIEALAARAARAPLPTALASTVQHTVDSLYLKIVRDRDGITDQDRTQIAAVVDQVSAWFPNGELDGWREHLLESLRLADR